MPAGSAAMDTTAAGAEAPADGPVVLFVGNSLSAGLGVGEEHAFPALIQQKIDSAGLPFQVRNAGVSGATSADGAQRIDWLLREPVSVLVLELGGNDALRGLDPSALEENLRTIVERTRSRYPDARIVLAGMKAPPNLGPEYVRRFDAVYPALARQEKVTLVPFLLAGVAGDPALNQADRIHPTVEGHRIVADTVWKYLEPVLESAAKQTAAAPALSGRGRPESR